MKIRTKTYFTFLFLGIILTLLGVFVYFIFFSNTYEKVVLNNLEILNNSKKHDIEVVIEDRISNDVFIIGAQDVDEDLEFFLKQENFNDYFSRIITSDKSIDEVFLLGSNGTILMSTNLNKINNIIDSEKNEDLFAYKRLFAGKVQEDDDGYFHFVSYPLASHDVYLVARYNLDYIIDVFGGNNDGSSEEYILGTKEGAEILLVNKKDENQLIIQQSQLLRLALEGKRGAVSNFVDYKGNSVMAAYDYIDRIDLALVTKEDRKKALAFFNEMILISLLLGLIIILLVYLAAGILSRALTRPIERLNEAVDVVSRGNYDYQMDVFGNDEISKTAKAFHKMAQAIKKSQEEANKQIAEQTKNLRDQQIAILNILEDVEAEKEKVADSAKELEKFKQAVENTSDHVVITDANGIIIYANKAVEVITGFSRDEVMGTKVGTKDNWGGLMGKDFYDNMWHTIKDEKKSFSGYLKNVRKNGEEYEALANISPVFDAGGNVIFFVGIERDFTREREIDRAKSEFVSLASHQLRTPLSTVNWYSEILLSEDAGKINKEQREYLQEIYKGNQRMVNLVNALLNVSRIDLGTLSIDPEPTNLIDLAESVLKELELKIKERKHKIVRNFDKGIPDINLDPKMMRIVWQNYLTNAVKYTPNEGTIEVNIKKKKTLVEISVKDDGMGIPKAQQEKIFEKLFRADNAREKETDGTGLGLYIVKSIIEEFGGKVWFKSKKNKGSTFYATIPLKGIKAKEGAKGLEYID